MKTCRLQPGHLMTRDERRLLRMIAGDLERQIDRCRDGARVNELYSQLESIRREQALDRELSPSRRVSGKKRAR